MRRLVLCVIFFLLVQSTIASHPEFSLLVPQTAERGEKVPYLLIVRDFIGEEVTCSFLIGDSQKVIKKHIISPTGKVGGNITATGDVRIICEHEGATVSQVVKVYDYHNILIYPPEEIRVGDPFSVLVRSESPCEAVIQTDQEKTLLVVSKLYENYYVANYSIEGSGSYVFNVSCGEEELAYLFSTEENIASDLLFHHVKPAVPYENGIVGLGLGFLWDSSKTLTNNVYLALLKLTLLFLGLQMFLYFRPRKKKK